jgi:uncharacterized Zn finger protein
MPAAKTIPQIPGLPLRPACPKCSAQMELVRTAPFKSYAGIQDLTYKCLKCGHSESWIASQNNPKAEGGESTYH